MVISKIFHHTTKHPANERRTSPGTRKGIQGEQTYGFAHRRIQQVLRGHFYTCPSKIFESRFVPRTKALAMLEAALVVAASMYLLQMLP